MIILEHIDEMDELNTYLRIGENIVGQSKVKNGNEYYVDMTWLSNTFHLI